MSISTIPNPDFVRCTECAFKGTRKNFLVNWNRPVRERICMRERPYKLLYGVKGCSKGRRSMA